MALAVAVGDLVDEKYRVVRLIGEGGWGLVFEAENVRTYKRVALKMLRANAGVTPDIQARFQREAQAAGRIGSEHIVEVFDLGVLTDGTHYMVMELLTGQDLATRLRERGPLEPLVALRVLIQLLDGLGAAHEAGILHRDLKPENLFLVPTRGGEEFVKILDFGISKFNLDAAGVASATMTGAVLGSPCYMAPEQARGLKQIDVRTDLYSVGALMFECLTGRVPFEGDNFNDLMFKIVLAPRPNPTQLNPSLDPRLAEIVMKSIACDPLERFQNAPEMRAAMVQWLESKGMPSVRPPELKRVFRTTPRTDGNRKSSTPGTSGTPPTQGRPSAIVTTKDPGHWSGETLRAESGTETPLASSSATPQATLQSRAAPQRKPAGLLWGIAVAGVLLATAVAGVGRVAYVRLAGQPAGAASASGAAAQPAPETRQPVEPPVAPSASEMPSVVLEPPAGATPAMVPERATPIAGPRSHAGAGGAASRASAAAARPPASTAASPPASAPDTPATASAPPAATTKAVGTIEGREIRTGL
jgi:serine/threonine-protein kinase